MDRRCAAGKPTSAGSSSHRPTNGSVRSTCRPRRTARCTSSTCIAASFSIEGSSPSTSAIRFCRGTWNTPSVAAASTGSSTTRRRGTSSHRCRRPRRPGSWICCHIRTAGGEIPRSDCWWSAMIDPRWNRCGRSRPARGRAADTPPCIVDTRRDGRARRQRTSRGRSGTIHGTSAWLVFAWRSGGFAPVTPVSRPQS